MTIQVQVVPKTLGAATEVVYFVKSIGAAYADGVTYGRGQVDNFSTVTPQQVASQTMPVPIATDAQSFNIWVQLNAGLADGVTAVVSVSAYSFVDLFSDF